MMRIKRYNTHNDTMMIIASVVIGLLLGTLLLVGMCKVMARDDLNTIAEPARVEKPSNAINASDWEKEPIRADGIDKIMNDDEVKALTDNVKSVER
jgi:hypothetical protein